LRVKVVRSKIPTVYNPDKRSWELMKAFTITLVVLFVLGVMIFTNPSLEDYRTFMTQELNKEVKKEARSEGEAALISILGGVATSFLADQTVRNDYLLFSTYRTSIGDERLGAIGALRNFFVTEAPKKSGG